MNLALDPRALARRPKQNRAIDRCELVLETAQTLLAEEGFEGFSIPAIAQRLGYTRASIYKFFPTPYAILNELVRRHFEGLEHRLAASAARIADLDWQDIVRLLVREGVKYHNAHPVGMMLALGGAVTDESFRTYALTVRHLGALGREVLRTRGVLLRESALDTVALAVDLGTTCMRHSYLLHGRITPAYRDAAADAMLDCLTRQLKTASP